MYVISCWYVDIFMVSLACSKPSLSSTDVCSSSYPAFPPLSAIAIHNTMWLESHWKNIRQTLLLLFTAALLIGVTMLAVSSNINPVGYFFLGVGGLCLIGYLLSVFAEYYMKHQQTQNANLAAPRMQSQAGWAITSITSSFFFLPFVPHGITISLYTFP